MKSSKEIKHGKCSKLIRAILLRKWSKVRALLGTKDGIEDAREVFDSGITVLSIASSCDSPPDIIKSLLDIEPLHSLKVDNFGMLPIHIACMTGASARAIKLILDHDGGACAQAIDVMHRAPLHYAIDYMCEPVGRRIGVPDINDASLSTQSMNTSEDEPEPPVKASKASKRSDDCSAMSMSQDRFMEQMQVVRYLIDASPEIVLFADSKGNTPIDILQDCKAESTQGPKWERADICCEVLRRVAIREYRDQKLVSEMQGYNCNRFSTSLSVPSMASSSGGSTGISGMSNLSKMEIDGTSYNRMDLSVSSDSLNDRVPIDRRIEMEYNHRPREQLFSLREEERIKEEACVSMEM